MKAKRDRLAAEKPSGMVLEGGVFVPPMIATPPDRRPDFQVPGGWEQYGVLPPFEPSERVILTEEDLDWLEEDIWQARSPEERLILDVGWYPSRDPRGSFRGVMVLNRDWWHPIKTISTERLSSVRSWVEAKLKPFL